MYQSHPVERSITQIATYKFWGLLLVGLILVLSGGAGEVSAVSSSAPGLPEPLLSEIALANLAPDNLATLNGIPVIPLYSIDPVIPGPNLNPPSNYLEKKAKIGIQVGHWRSNELPGELAALRGSLGASNAGIGEPEIGLDTARRLAVLLQAQNIEADILPATVPPGYRANAFISLHSDWSSKSSQSGFKVARSRYSLIPQADDRLVELLYTSYARSTQLHPDWNITRNMTAYYAFNFRLFQHSINSTTPAVIIEMGFLTNSGDFALLRNRQDLVAQGLAGGLTAYLNEEGTSQPAPLHHVPVLLLKAKRSNLVPVYLPDSAGIIAYLNSGQQLVYFEKDGEYYNIWMPVLNRTGRVKAEEASVSTG